MDQKEPYRPSDRQLVERVLSGNTRAFGMIIKDTETLVAQIVFRMIAGHDQRRDVAQDIYVKVFQKLESFRFQSKLSTWIARIAYNTCINQLEKNKSTPSLLVDQILYETSSEDDTSHWEPADASDLVDELIQEEFSGLLQSALERLPPLYKLLITLYHQQELSYHQICEIVALPEGTVKSYLFRARRMLRDRIQTIYNQGI
ncbi:RNA polymerase sigma-70 factor, ECF subfamily [Dyadobacter soli]|uniref:RNA polymerase sigma-70 factor, ECF subfamily n=1 Tax=Dyadobacter soli TaxID=659014 RepID=A0A1G7MMH6_9BACT|nr:sigma-70 family RNA polymerase sigma factor [Dyadobacter soli]SDF62320.1 RNA polymerase sigma-70 factor, ECF subfamily [Dyadobacter soli]